MTIGSAPPIQPESDQHKDFGQPVVSDHDGAVDEGRQEDLLTPSQAAARFEVPEYLLRKECADGHLAHLRVVNAIWLTAGAVAAFARSWRARKAGPATRPAPVARRAKV
jgi:hypothetical protein